MRWYEYLDGQSFAREAEKLNPEWHDTFNLTRYLEAFDEAGLLRPLYRVVFPPEYAVYNAQINHMPVASELDEEEFARLDRLSSEYYRILRVSEPCNPSLPCPFDDPTDTIRPFVARGDSNDLVDWNDWRKTVGQDDRGEPVEQVHAFSIYGSWQMLRYWVLLFQFTLRVLLDPRKVATSDIWHLSGKHDQLWDSVLTYRWRMQFGRVLKGLEVDEWLRRVHQVGAEINWSHWRMSEPEQCGWSEGKVLSEEARWSAIQECLNDRLSDLGAPWKGDRKAFFQNIGRLIEFRGHLDRLSAATLRDRVTELVNLSVRWGMRLYEMTFEEVNQAVHVPWPGDTSVASVLRPVWWRVQLRAGQLLQGYRSDFNSTIAVVTLDDDDVSAYLDFLGDQQLWAWKLELVGLLSARRDDEALWERQFLRLRSLAALCEPILLALVERYGTPMDRDFNPETLKSLMSAFLHRRPSWFLLPNRLSDRFALILSAF